MTKMSTLVLCAVLRYQGPNPKNKSDSPDLVWGVARLVGGGPENQIVTCYGPYGGTMKFHRHPIEGQVAASNRFLKLAGEKRAEHYVDLTNNFASKIIDVFKSLEAHPLVDNTSTKQVIGLPQPSSSPATATGAQYSSGAGCAQCGHATWHHGEAGCIHGNCACQWNGSTQSNLKLVSADLLSISECAICRVNKIAGAVAERTAFYKLVCERCYLQTSVHNLAHPHEGGQCRALRLPDNLLRVASNPESKPEPELEKGVQPQPKREQRSIRHLLPTDL